MKIIVRRKHNQCRPRTVTNVTYCSPNVRHKHHCLFFCGWLGCQSDNDLVNCFTILWWLFMSRIGGVCDDIGFHVWALFYWILPLCHGCCFKALAENSQHLLRREIKYCWRLVNMNSDGSCEWSITKTWSLRTHNLLIGFMASYDTLKLNGLWQIMYIHGFPAQMMRLVRATLDDSKSNIWIA